MGKGGGGQSQPSSQTVTQTSIPQYARPYVERMLGKAEALTETPYQPYGGQRIAEFNPLQQQAFESAANLGPARQLGVGTEMAGIAGLGGLGAGQRYAQMATNPYATQAYMSPYIEGALAPQMREARRQSDISGLQSAGQAVKAGAFGGSRFGLQEAERQRNLSQLQSDIYGRGMQTAFEQARQAQQFGADLGLRGYGLAGQLAGTLGQLGQTQFAQQQAAIQAQAAAGAQQQQLEQEKLTQQYQDFLTQRGYPQQQLAFMSDILRGVPLGQQTQQQYTTPASLASQLAQAGLGAYGMYKTFGSGSKEGGIIKAYKGGGAVQGYADGGQVPVDKLRSMLNDMSNEQLQQIKASTDNAITLSLVDEEQRLRQRIENSQILAKAIPETTIKDEMVAQGGIDVPEMSAAVIPNTGVGEAAEEEAQPEMARGGIVAFAKAGKVEEKKPDYTAELAALDPNAALMSEEERGGIAEAGRRRFEEYMGPDTSAEKIKELGSDFRKAFGPEAKEELKGIMALKAASKYGRRGKTFGEETSDVFGGLADDLAAAKKAENEAKKQLTLAELDYEKAKRAEKRGNFEVGERLADRAENRKEKAYQFNQQKLEKLQDAKIKREDIASREKVGMAQVAAQRAAVNRRDFNLEVLENFVNQNIADFTKANGRPPNQQELAQIRGAASEQAAKLLKVDPYGAGRLNVQVENAVSSRLKADKVYNDLALQLMTADPKDKPAIQTAMDRREQQIRGEVQASAGAQPQAPQQGSAPPQVMGSPLPKTKKELQTGTVYETSRGPARWNGKEFEAIQ